MPFARPGVTTVPTQNFKSDRDPIQLLAIVTILAAAAVLPPGMRSLGAQTAQTDTADRVMAAAMARHAGILTADSMQGDDLSSPGLERRARYVAGQFQAMGLEPAGDSGGWIQRYPIPGQATLASGRVASLWFSSQATYRGKNVINDAGYRVIRLRELGLPTTAVPATDTLLDFRAPGYAASGQGNPADDVIGLAPVVLAGPHTLTSVRQANLRDKVVVYVPAVGSDSMLQRQIVALLTTANHVIIVVDDDSAAWAARHRAAHPPVVLPWYVPAAQPPRRWAIYVQLPTIQDELVTAGFDVAAARTATMPRVQEISAEAMLNLELPGAASGPTAPNAVGRLQGSTPGQALVLTVHMDSPDVSHGPGERLASQASDNAWAVAALLALAQALKQRGVPPRRSIVFAAVSGDVQGRWGSHALMEKLVPSDQIVLNINLDLSGPVSGDSLRIAGLPDVELPVSPAWLAAQRPELGLTVVDEGSSVAGVSEHTAAAEYADHLAFVQNLVPSLYVHGTERVATPGAAAQDGSQAAPILRFVSALTQVIADAPRAPAWTTEGRRQRARVFGR